MFYVVEESENKNEVTATFENNKVVRLVRDVEGDPSAYVEGTRIYGNYGKSWNFPHGEDGEDRDAAVAEAEQLFRDIVAAIAEDKPLNLSDFDMKPKAASRKKAPAKSEEQPTEQPSGSEPAE